MKSSLLIIRRWMAKDDVPMRFTERVWAAARATQSWTCAPSPATSWQPARKKAVGEAVWGLWGGRVCRSGHCACRGTLSLACSDGHASGNGAEAWGEQLPPAVNRLC